MKQLSEQQIVENWNKLMKLIEDTFEGDRLKKLKTMYTYFEDRMSIAPASGKAAYHNAMVGGYIEHVLHVTDCALKIKKLWEEDGAMINFTDEELIFAAMHHDLGKVGDLDDDNYLPNPSEWHIKNQGKTYINNPDLKFMTPPDRGIWILNQYGISMTQNEYIGIKLTDGMYDEGNIQYLKSYAPEKKLKSNMQHILHQADMTTTRIEYEDCLHTDEEVINTSVPKDRQEQKQVDNLKSKFDELFAN